MKRITKDTTMLRLWHGAGHWYAMAQFRDGRSRQCSAKIPGNAIRLVIEDVDVGFWDDLEPE